MSHVIQHSDAVIENGNTEATGSVDLYGYLFAGIIVPAEFDGVAITFQGSQDNSTFFAVHDETGSAVSVTVAASRHVLIPPRWFQGCRYVKLVAGGAQTGDTTCTLVLHRED